MSAPNSLRYRPEIDGLRAVAVIAVLIFHSGFGVKGGFAGVDVFFVISGYLIGSIIIRDVENGAFSFIAFWLRRIRRLFPALAVVLVSTTILSLLIFIPVHLEAVGGALAAQPVFAANFYFWSESGYFDPSTDYQPLLHTWSLAVEEQFYLFLPPVLVFALARGRSFAMKVVLIFLSGSFAWSIYASSKYPTNAYFLPFSRIWELDIGVALALLQGKKPGRLMRELLSWGGLAFVVCSFFVIDKSTAFPGWVAIFPCVGTALVIYANQHIPSTVGRVLSTPVMVGIGRISYPLYLWHWPLIVFSNYLWFGQTPKLVIILALAISFVLAWLTCRFLESPVRAKRFFSSTRSLVGTSIAFSLLFVGIGKAIESGRIQNPEIARESGVEVDKRIGIPGIVSIEGWGNDKGNSRVGSTGKSSAEVLVWGDSHSLAILPVLDDLGKDYNVAIQAASQAGDPPILGVHSRKYPDTGAIYDERVEALLSEGSFKAAILVARWPIYIEGTPDGSTSYVISPPDLKWNRREAAKEAFQQYFPATIRALEEKGIDVYILLNVGYQPLSAPETMAQLKNRELSVNSFALSLEHYRNENRAVTELIENSILGTKATILDPLPYLTDERGIYLMMKDGLPLYSDRSHLSPFGSRQLRDLFEPLMRKYSK